MKQPGTFEGTYNTLEALRKRRDARIHWEARVITPDTKLFVDGAGTIYAPNPSSGKLTTIVGYCEKL